MQAQSTTASFRKLTPSMLASQQLAMANDIVKTTKAEVALALKKAAPALGITGTTYHILDILIGLTAADDWKQDHRPLVAISNEKLSEYVCRSTRTVTRSLKKLVEAGILSYRDSPTGRRYIHRDGPKNGKLGDIQRGFGLDFSPARQRVHELKEIGAAFAQKLQAQKDAKRTITRLTRSLKDLFELAQHEGISCSNMAKAHSNLQEKKFEVVSYAEALTALYECVQLEIHSKMSIAGDINALPYNHTNSQDSKNCNKIRKLSNDNTFNSKEPANGQKRALEKTIESNSSANESKLSPVSKINKSQSKLGISPLHGITLQLLQAACRLTQDTLAIELSSWSALLINCADMCLLIGLSESAWLDAKQRLGDYAAAAILITTVEKALREPELIAAPGGYFCACVARAAEGKLALRKSLFGLRSLSIE